jgi:hypothetical protein
VERSLAHPVAPSRPLAVVVRLLIAAGLVIGWLQPSGPVERGVGDLFMELSDGAVETLTISRPAPGTEDAATLPVRWTGASGSSYAFYEHTGGPAGTDEGVEILAVAASSPVPVAVAVRDDVDIAGPRVLVGGIAAFAAFVLLVAGPQPRLGTKWAWFWLGAAVAGGWLAFVVLEPVPFSVRQPLEPARTRVTGGAGLALALVLLVVFGLVAEVFLR